MGWLFGRKKAPESADEMLRRYNDEQAARLAALSGNAGAEQGPVPNVGGSSLGELTVEDVFTITGRGKVATGRVTTGRLRVGDRVVIMRDGTPPMPAEIAAIEMLRKKANEASVGSTVGILFRDRPDVVRGDVIRTTASA
ncbi:EF-Tu/IF-2/RF-3 family GTPase [Microbacterium sp. NPDC090003]|uniref:EF-Tu/IF-2/RF-3 family GTPase n=1 Tax=Microbacterium sp. NPDC090003 TaxID=3364203 RepID=UPI0037F66C18